MSAPSSLPSGHVRAAESMLLGRTSAAVLSAMGQGQPDSLLRALVAEARRRDVALTIYFADLSGRFSFLDEADEPDVRSGRLRLVSLAGAVHRRWSALTDYVPHSLWDIDRMLRRGDLPIDFVVAGLQVAGDGTTECYGDMVGYTPSALETSAVAVFDILETPGPRGVGYSCWPELRRADFILRGGAAPPRPVNAALTHDQTMIGLQVASLIPDGSTLQLGLGGIAEAVVRALGTKRGLRLHSGILLPQALGLFRSGAANGLAVGTGIHGSQGPGSDDWVGNAELRSLAETHDPTRLLALERLWSVNSALEVDLTGAVNAEFADGIRVASGGGQSDFVRAAHASAEGASVIALPARTNRGRSRIVRCIAVPATSAGQDVDFIVTEHGVASLRGKTAKEKALAVALIAHPDDRASLIEGAADCHEVAPRSTSLQQTQDAAAMSANTGGNQ